MAIVRSLLISLGFVTDKRAINQANRAITGFKTRFAIAASAATYAFSKMVGFFSDIATATVDASELATTLGISLKEFYALQEAASNFRLDPKQFEGTLKTVNKLFRDFKTGASNQLAEISRQLGFNIDRRGNAVDVFNQIIKALSEITNVQERIRISENIFGDTGAKIAALAGNVDDFTKAVENLKNAEISEADLLPDAQKFESQLNQLYNSWKKFTTSLGILLLNPLTKFVEYLKLLTDAARFAISGDKEGSKRNLKELSDFAEPATQATRNVFGLGGVLGSFAIEKLLNAFSSFQKYAENRQEFSSLAVAGNSLGVPIVNNEINVNLLPGTDQQKASEIALIIGQTVEDSVNRVWSDIQSNNPVVE